MDDMMDSLDFVQDGEVIDFGDMRTFVGALFTDWGQEN